MTSTRQRLLLLGTGLLCGAAVLNACSAEDGSQDMDIELATRSQDTLSTPLTPLLHCMDSLGNHNYRAHFGYVNQSSRSVRVPVGLLNLFVPLPKDQGQPVDFAPGEHRDVFTVNFSTRDGWDRLAWWLTGRRALATRHTPICTPPECASNSDCDDELPCTSDVCNAGSCQHPPASAGTACGHGDLCNGAGQCVDCIGASDCDDELPCTSDVCSAGACSHPPAPAGTSCGHGGSCDGAGVCAPPCSVDSDCDDELPCTTDACSAGVCSHPPAPAGTSCGHGSSCDGAGGCL
jgi:hypothetical protein